MYEVYHRIDPKIGQTSQADDAQLTAQASMLPPGRHPNTTVAFVPFVFGESRLTAIMVLLPNINSRCYTTRTCSVGSCLPA